MLQNFPELMKKQHRIAAACRTKGIGVFHVRPAYDESGKLGGWMQNTRDFFPHYKGKPNMGCVQPPDRETCGDFQVLDSNVFTQT